MWHVLCPTNLHEADQKRKSRDPSWLACNNMLASEAFLSIFLSYLKEVSQRNGLGYNNYRGLYLVSNITMVKIYLNETKHSPCVYNLISMNRELVAQLLVLTFFCQRLWKLCKPAGRLESVRDWQCFSRNKAGPWENQLVIWRNCHFITK